MPAALFGCARAAGLNEELDWHCRRAAFDGARALGRGMLFVNVEPSTLGQTGVLGITDPATAGAHRSDRHIVLEITERAVTAHPGDLLKAVGLSSPGILLTTLQNQNHVTPAMARRNEHVASSCSLTAVFGVGMSADPAPGVRAGPIDADDPLGEEWSVFVIGAHEAVGLVARGLGDLVPQSSRRLEFAVTHDRSLVLRAARILLDRL